MDFRLNDWTYRLNAKAFRVNEMAFRLNAKTFRVNEVAFRLNQKIFRLNQIELVRVQVLNCTPFLDRYSTAFKKLK